MISLVLLSENKLRYQL